MRSSRQSAAAGSGSAQNTVYVGSLDSPDRVELLTSDYKAIYADGYLLFVRDRRLLAQAFDTTRLQLTGDVFPVAQEVAVSPGTARAAFSASTTGALTYRAGGGGILSQLVWRDRTGKQLDVLGTPGEYGSVNLSPDGTRVAVALLDPSRNTRDIWLYDVARGVPTRLSFDAANEFNAVWSPDSARLVFDSNRSSQYDLYEKASSGVGDDQSMAATLGGQLGRRPFSWSRDGRYLLYEAGLSQNGDIPREGSVDLWALPLFGDRKAFPVLQTRFQEIRGELSGDGRWITYTSNESGRNEVYVAPFPAADDKWIVSTAGGSFSRWRSDGKELFYLAADNRLVAVAVDGRGPKFQIGSLSPLFEKPPGPGFKPFDVSPDGQRFLINAFVEQPSVAPMTVVLNWTAGLKK